MESENALVQLVTRVPAELRRRVKVQCLLDSKSIMEFVTEALVEKLAARKNGGHRRKDR